MFPFLAWYPQRAAVAYLYVGFKQGFRIPCMGLRVAMGCTNLKSARDLPDIMATKINKDAGWAGWLAPSPFPRYLTCWYPHWEWCQKRSQGNSG